MQSYSRGDILKANITSGSPTRVLNWSDYKGLPIEPCNEYYLPDNSALPLILPWLYDYDLASVMNNGMGEISRRRKVADNLALHDEIIAFMEYMTPTKRELEVREDLLARFTQLLESSKLPISAPEPYGSYVTGLFVATSDIDVFVTRRQHATQRDALGQVHRYLMAMPSPQFHKRIRDVLKASVPLLSIVDDMTGLTIDLTAEPFHSEASTRVVVDWLKRDPHLGHEPIIKMLVVVVKTFLAIRRCGTTYTGGINSYVVVWLVVSWVKMELPKLRQKISSSTKDPLSTKPSNVVPDQKESSAKGQQENICQSDPDYGEILMEFLRFYGEEFDYEKTKIIIRSHPQYSRKPRHQKQPFLLSLIDPADSSIDLGSKAYGIKHVVASFKEAYQQLKRLGNERMAGTPVGQEGILGKVLGGDFIKTLQERINLAQ